MEQEELIKRIEERKGNRTYSNIITALWAWGFENNDDEAVAVDDLQGVVNYVGKRFRDDAVSEPNISIHIQGKPEELTDKYIYAHSEVYKTDDRNGVCADGDPLSIRYVKCDVSRVFKMKCGKFFRRIIDETHPEYPEPVRVYFAEQLSAIYRAGHAGDGRYRLTLDRDFEKIYSGHSNFGSCMNDKGQWKFYRDSMPDALAAGLWDGDKLIARCIVWTAVHDEDHSEKTYRLAERQYGENSEARRQLIYLLAEQNKIDGHKQFECSCWDNRSYVLLDGTKLNNSRLWVRCTAQPGDTLSFQDGFRWLQCDDERAVNWETRDGDIDLAITGRIVPGQRGRDGELRDGRRYVERDEEWYDDDHCLYLEYRDMWCHEDDAYYCEHTDSYYLCDDTYCLYDGTYCHYDDARTIEAGEHEGQYAYYEDDDLVTDYDDRYVLRDDCYELSHGEHEGEYAPSDECKELDCDIYGSWAYALESETVETCNYETILLEDAVEIDGDFFHKDDCVRAFDRRFGKFVDALSDDCVEISGTFYLMDVA